MIRKSFRMSGHAGHEAEYFRRHNPIWRDLEETLLTHGVRSYSIFLDAPTRDLFAYVEIEDEARWQAIRADGRLPAWWHFMREIMPANRDGSPGSDEPREVFHIEAPGRY